MQHILLIKLISSRSSHLVYNSYCDSELILSFARMFYEQNIVYFINDSVCFIGYRISETLVMLLFLQQRVIFVLRLLSTYK